MAKTPDGYYGVIIPKYDFYQGFFLYEHPASIKHLERLRNKPIAEIRKPASGVSDADQGVLGGLCAALVEGARTANQPLLIQTSGAIAILADSKYFVVRGEIDPKGIATAFWRMPPEISSPDAARDYVHSLPEVQLIQGKLLKEAVELALGEKKKQ